MPFFTIATRSPSDRKISVFTGSRNVVASVGSLRCTSANDPGRISPPGLSRSISTSRVREAASIDCAVRASTPVNVRPGSSWSSIVAGTLRARRARIDLRHVDEDAQPVHRGDVEELLGGAARSDQRADVGVARGDHAGERRVDGLEALQLLEPLDVGVRGQHRGLLRFVAAVGVVEVLPRHRVGLDQILVALGGRPRQALVRLRGRQVGARLEQLLIDLGRVDLGEHLPGLHLRSDVGVARLQVAGGPREDRGVGEGLDVAGQRDFLRRGRRATAW